MHCARRGQLEKRPSASGVPLSRGGGSEATEHGVAACHLCGELEREAHGLPFTDWLGNVANNLVSQMRQVFSDPVRNIFDKFKTDWANFWHIVWSKSEA